VPLQLRAKGVAGRREVDAAVVKDGGLRCGRGFCTFFFVVIERRARDVAPRRHLNPCTVCTSKKTEQYGAPHPFFVIAPTRGKSSHLQIATSTAWNQASYGRANPQKACPAARRITAACRTFDPSTVAAPSS
jgi:hypothetical protein